MQTLLKTKTVISVFCVAALLATAGCLADNQQNVPNTGVETSNQDGTQSGVSNFGRISSWAKNSWNSVKSTAGNNNGGQAQQGSGFGGLFGGASNSGGTSNQNQLNNDQIVKLLSNKTVYSSNANNAAQQQVGYFASDYSLRVFANNQRLSGSWSVNNNALCLNLNGQSACNAVYFTPAAQAWEQPRYYMSDTNGQTSIVINALRDGNSDNL